MINLNTLKIVLSCNGRTLSMGPDEDIDITAVSGLEASEFDIATSDNALVDGVTVDGKKVKARPIHIEAAFRSLAHNPANRDKLVKFFNPKYTGKALIENMGTPRNIEYELEGWSIEKAPNLNSRIKFVVDLICPDPYMQNVDNFGKNMANITPQWAYPYIATKQKIYDVELSRRGLTLGGKIAGYRTLRQEVILPNDGDVPTGVIVKFVAARGDVTNPSITLLSTGQFVRVVVAMQEGDVLVVDTNERHQVIELNGVNIYQKIDRKSDPFQLAVGDNSMEYSADLNYVNLDVYVYYTPKYLGV